MTADSSGLEPGSFGWFGMLFLLVLGKIGSFEQALGKTVSGTDNFELVLPAFELGTCSENQS